MKLVHVIPIAKGIKRDTLSYFSSKKLQNGELVLVPLRTRTVPAIVVGSDNVKDVKAKLKSSDFAMKKIVSKGTKSIILPEFIEAAKVTAEYSASSVGAVLHQVIPKLFFENIEKISRPVATNNIDKGEISAQVLAFQASSSTRLDDYRRLVRESFARGNSAYIMTPTIRSAEQLHNKLSKGIEKYVFTLHSNITKRELIKRLNTILKEPHPILIIGTGSFLATARNDIGTIIVENESSKSYKLQSRPYTDYRLFARNYAAALGARIIYADMPLSVETMWKLKQREYDELSSTRTRLTTDANQYIIDMRPEKGKKDFFVISTQLNEQIESSTNKDERTFIFNARKGIAPTTVCEECGTVVTCKLCHASVVLHSTSEGNAFICHTCGSDRSAKERCSNCKSWKLKALGVGSERIKTELTNLYGKDRIFSVDGDVTRTYKQALKEVTNFYKTPGSVLVGTGLSLSFLDKPIETCAIASIDSLLSLPDPKMYENIFSLILKIRSLASKSFILQTRQPELSIIKEAVEGNVSKFYEGEILNRRRFEYPPFTTLIKISSFGTIKHITKEMDLIEKELAGYSFQIYPAFSRVDKTKFVLNALLRVPSKDWPNNKLLTILRGFSPSIGVNVGPESTL